MVQLGKKMVQSGKNEICDPRPVAPEELGRKKRCSPRLSAPGGPQRSMRSPRPDVPGVSGREMRGPQPGAPEGPGRKKMCSPRLSHPGPHWRPRMEQGIKTDHLWIYLNRKL